MLRFVIFSLSVCAFPGICKAQEVVTDAEILRAQAKIYSGELIGCTYGLASKPNEEITFVVKNITANEHRTFSISLTNPAAALLPYMCTQNAWYLNYKGAITVSYVEISNGEHIVRSITVGSR